MHPTTVNTRGTPLLRHDARVARVRVHTLLFVLVSLERRGWLTGYLAGYHRGGGGFLCRGCIDSVSGACKLRCIGMIAVVVVVVRAYALGEAPQDK